jgi:HEAT repeat protein
LLPLLEDSHFFVRGSAADALGKIGSQRAIPGLLQLLEDSDYSVRGSAADALGKIGSQRAIPGLLQLLEHSDSDVRRSAADALGKIGSQTAIDALLPLLEHSDSDVRGSAAEALGKISSERAIDALLPLLEDSDYSVRGRAASVLGNIAKKYTEAIAQHLPHLLTLIPTDSGQDALPVILAIQENCKFYNYEIWQEAIQNEKLEINNGEQGAAVGQVIEGTHVTPHYTVNTEVFQVIEHNDGNVIGKQSPDRKSTGDQSC